MGRLNNRGITLVELLATITISSIIIGIISSVLVQSFRSAEIADTHINLRQEANIVVSMFSSAHLSAGSEPYMITFQRMNATEWVMTIGDNTLDNRDYHLRLELKSSTGTSSFIIDTTDTNTSTLALTINKKIPLNIQKLTLTNKKDPTKKFELSTIISRL
jgi:prepilin-type N-terminal cleavage/methylation domain-containing protein